MAAPDLALLKKLSSSAEFRDKFLKGCQYAAKLAVVLLTRMGRESSRSVPTLKAASKTLSSARRFIVLLRWMKYVDDLRVAQAEPHAVVRRLSLTDVVLNVVVDMMQDMVTLGRLGVFGYGVVPVWFEKLADQIDVCISANSLALTGLKLARASEALRGLEYKESQAKVEAIATEQIELLKYACDLLKTLDSAGRTPGEGIAATAAVISSALSAKKIVAKARTK